MAENLPADKLRELEERLERIENWMGISGLKPTPGFDPVLFQQALNRSLMPLWVFFALALVACFVVSPLILRHVGPGGVSQSQLFGLRLFAVNGFVRPAVVAVHGIGLVSVGGAGVGVIALGGLAVGIVAIGGGAIGILSFGGGSLGVIAFGGGAIGYIAIGGGAFGKYVLAGDGKGRYVFDRKWQDPEAVKLFCRWFPRLRQAFTAEKPTSS